MPKAALISGITPGPAVSFSFGARVIPAFSGEPVAAALLRAGVDGTRTAPRTAEPRGYYCGMGVCWECVVEIEGEGNVRGCLFPVRDGLVARAAVARSEEDL